MSVEETRERVLLIGKCYLGYHEGNNNDTKFGDWYGMPNQPWCAMFVSYCMAKAGVSQETVKKFASCTAGWNWFKNRGETRSNSFKPQRGDIIFFDWNPENGDGIDHVGLVDRVENNKVYTVEGNHEDQVNQYSYDLNSNNIYGYVVPSYTGNESIEEAKTDENNERPLIYKGMTNENVRYAQTKLINKGYSVGSSGADGIFGAGTEQAVRQFQADNGLTADGMIGPATWKKLEESTTVMPSSYPGAVIGMGARGENVVKIQNELIRRGYDVPGGADGQYGSGARNAVRAFQKDHGLDIDGDVGEKTWYALFPKQQTTIEYPNYLISMGMSDANVKMIQKRLSDLGFSIGNIDGIFGEKTKNAVMEFQRMRGLDADGIVGEKTWNVLFDIKKSDDNRESEKKDDIKTVETLKLAMKEELVPYLDGIMTLVQRGKARRSREEAFIDLMNCDDIITKYSQKYKVRKSLIQTIFLWEHGVEGIDDILGDKAVREYYENNVDIGKHDCSTGYCQIYGYAAINAWNFAVKEKILKNKDFIEMNHDGIGSMWLALYYNGDFNIEMATLNLLYCGYQENGAYDYDTDPSNIKRILARYNGTDDRATEYGERNYGLYRIFEKYNAAMRVANI